MPHISRVTDVSAAIGRSSASMSIIFIVLPPVILRFNSGGFSFYVDVTLHESNRPHPPRELIIASWTDLSHCLVRVLPVTLVLVQSLLASRALCWLGLIMGLPMVGPFQT